MTYLLDANTCIRYLNGTSESIRKHIATTHPREIAVCAVVKAELFYGAHNSRHPNTNLGKQRTFLGRFVSLPFDDQAAEAYGHIRAQLKKPVRLLAPTIYSLPRLPYHSIAFWCPIIPKSSGEFLS